MSDLTLLLNAAEHRLQCGLMQDGQLLVGQDWAAAAQGAELLTPALADVLKLLHLTPSMFTRIACVAGPGSFTGLRLALTTASALHQSLGIPVAALNYLELLAESTFCQDGTCIRPIIHARRDVVCLQDFIRTADGLVPRAPARAGPPSASVADLPDMPTLLIGSGIGRHPEVFQSLPAHAAVLVEQCSPSWDAFVRLARRAAYLECDPVPNYLRDSEAEDNLESLAARRGDAPEAARAALEQMLTAPPVSVW